MSYSIVAKIYSLLEEKWFVGLIRHLWQFKTVDFVHLVSNMGCSIVAKIYSFLETSGGQSSNLFLNVVHFFNTGAN